MHSKVKYNGTDIFIAIMVLFCSLCFIYSYDVNAVLTITDEFKKCLFDGNVKNFYKIAFDYSVVENEPGYLPLYNILCYFSVFLMLLPIYFVEFIAGTSFIALKTFWYKLCLGAIALLAGERLRKIGKQMGLSDAAAGSMKNLYLSSAFVLAGAVGFGQLDIIGAYIFLWAIWFYVKKDYVKFSVVTSIAVCFKGFVLLFYIPMLLVRKKKDSDIIKNILLCSILPLVITIVCRFMSGYSEVKEEAQNSWNHLSRLWEVYFPTGHSSSAFIITVLIIFIFAYFMNSDKDKSWIGICCLSGFCFMFFIRFNPQWLVVVVPFLCLAVYVFEDKLFNALTFLLVNVGYLIMLMIITANGTVHELIVDGLLGTFINWKNPEGYLIGIIWLNNISERTVTSIFYAGIILMTLSLIFELRGKHLFNIPNKHSEQILNKSTYINLSVVIVYTLLTFAAHI